MPTRMTRRQLALAAAATAAAAQTQETYSGALAGFETRLDTGAFDPVRWTMARHDAAPVRLAFNATTRRQAEAWERTLREKVIQLAGGFPQQRCALHAQTL